MEIDWTSSKIPLGVYSFKAYSLMKFVSHVPIDFSPIGEIYLRVPDSKIATMFSTKAKARAKFVHELIGITIKNKLFQKGHIPSKTKIIYPQKDELLICSLTESVYARLEPITEYEGYLILTAMMDAVGLKSNRPALTDDQISDQRQIIGEEQFDPIKAAMLENLSQELDLLVEESKSKKIALLKEKQDEYKKVYGDGEYLSSVKGWGNKSFTEIYGHSMLFPEWREMWDQKLKTLETEYDTKIISLKRQMFDLKLDGHLIVKKTGGTFHD